MIDMMVLLSEGVLTWHRAMPHLASQESVRREVEKTAKNF
jgi:hypothetical protein